MKVKNTSWALYLIIITIIISIVIQSYWNYKNYLENKRIFINTVQNSLDNAVDTYFTNIATKEFQFTPKSTPKNFSIEINTLDSLSKKSSNILISNISNNNDNSLFIDLSSMDSLKTTTPSIISMSLDSIKRLKKLSSIWISLNKNIIHLENIKPLLKKELQRKDFHFSFNLNYYKNNELIQSTDTVLFKNTIHTFSSVVFLKDYEQIELVFPNQVMTILKRGSIGILLSFILSISIIASLLYLLKVITNQKQMAEIKNDFISNITHEFKTPITTIGLATDALMTFNNSNPEKTKEYLKITKDQLKKLHTMVEKVLETSILDNDKLLLQKEPVNLITLIEQSVQKHFLPKHKTINFKTNTSSLILNLDRFHFENAINNLIDNAIKYGGNTITISVKIAIHQIEIDIMDSGKINKKHSRAIFDKFYRIPQGNTHNTKGFGIGLYYAKHIIEKHQGSILLIDTVSTHFKITLPK